MVTPVETAFVKIWDQLVGAVAWDAQQEYATFEYDPGFLEMGLNLAPLRMPLGEARRGTRKFAFRTLPKETFYGLPGMLADALPDRFGNAIIDTWLARQGRSADDFSPIERLCYTGKRAMGALEFEPAINPKLDSSTPVEVEELVALAQEVINDRMRVDANLVEEPTEALLDIIRVGTSAGGMRPKAVIALKKETGEVRSGQVRAPDGFSYWILKFDGVEDDALGDPKGYGRVEYAYHHMAGSAGIEMMECDLLEEKGRAHFLTRRFDRTDNGERLHLQSLCALEHFDFNSPGMYSYEQAFETIRKLRLPFRSIEQQYRRMVFNVVARNLDDHTKNIAFLMHPHGGWSLAPAFDVIYAHNPDGPWTRRHQMTINGKSDDISRADLVRVGVEASVKTCREIVDEVVEAVRRWPDFAENAQVPDNRIGEIGRNHVLL
ncbi:type II toxin-antitoxin system HipA family toxin [Gemmatimonadota bacterium]